MSGRLVARAITKFKNPFHSYMHVLDLPNLLKDQVKEFHELFSEAIKWYEQTQIRKKEKTESENPKYSLLPDLKKSELRKQKIFLKNSLAP